MTASMPDDREKGWHMKLLVTLVSYGILAGAVAIAIAFVIILLVSQVTLFIALPKVGYIPLRYNFQNLVLRWKTTIATTLAYTLVVALLVAMIAFVRAMYRMTGESGVPSNVMVLADGSLDEVFSNLGYNDTSNLERQPGVLSDEQGRPLCSKEVYVIVNQPIVGEKKQRRFLQIRGIASPPDISGRVHNLELASGTWFSEAGVRELPDGQTAIDAVLGEGIASVLGNDLGQKSLQVGDIFDVGNRKWAVAGIMKSSGNTFGSEIWAKQDYVSKMFGKESYTTIVLRTKSAAQAEVLALDLRTNFTEAKVMAVPEPEYFEKLSKMNVQFLAAIIVVALIMAIGGVLGVMNTMFAAISQRTKDIGVLRIVGFTRREVLASFLLESLLMAVLGGLVGCALGYLVNGITMTSIVSGGQGGGGKSVVLELIVDAWTLGIGLLFALEMGLIGGVFPSLSAMRLRPLESLQ
jgi:ABC-type lipoprotein release transport system permease subunit